jgi:sec-independent protein translocase protein TatA
MGGFSLWHWLVVIILVMLLFGRGRISDLMGDLGKGLKSFKEGMGDEEASKRHEPPRSLENRPIDVTPQAPRTQEPAAPPPPPPADDTTPRS